MSTDDSVENLPTQQHHDRPVLATTQVQSIKDSWVCTMTLRYNSESTTAPSKIPEYEHSNNIHVAVLMVG